MPFLDGDGVEELSSQIHTLCDAEYAKLTDLQSVFIQRNYQYSATVAANSTAQITGTQLGVSTPDGYTPIAINRVNIGTAGMVIAGLHPNATESRSVIEVRNTTSAAITQNVNIFILYVKTALMG